jgi:uracil DNA glycosylase
VVSQTEPKGSSATDRLKLGELFEGGGEAWGALLGPVIERQPGAERFIGPARGPSVVPLRELTFQALKPNPPGKWKVIVFGQNPYPRVESATGIAMFDNAFTSWQSNQLERVASVRCILKAALVWKHGASRLLSPRELRAELIGRRVVEPPEWFQAMLAQGVLLLNAALTASTKNALGVDLHTAFWRPVIEAIVEEILRAKSLGPPADRAVVFAWWGAHARGLRPMVEAIQKRYPAVRVAHVNHCNPAARDDLFCQGNHFADLARALDSVRLGAVDWLPVTGWNHQTPADVAADATRMGDFIAHTRALHQIYLERLQSVGDETAGDLPPISGVMTSPLVPLSDAITPATGRLAGLDQLARRAQDFARVLLASGATTPLGANQIAALHLYTMSSPFYRQLNAALRDPARAETVAYFPYLRLLLSALGRLPREPLSLWRGVTTDMRAQYPVGEAVTWWGVSSCTSEPRVARGFLGSSGPRTLFEIRSSSAVGLRTYSAFSGEQEFLLAPGTRLEVRSSRRDTSGLSTIVLDEIPGGRLVS